MPGRTRQPNGPPRPSAQRGRCPQADARRRLEPLSLITDNIPSVGRLTRAVGAVIGRCRHQLGHTVHRIRGLRGLTRNGRGPTIWPGPCHSAFELAPTPGKRSAPGRGVC